MKRFLFLITFFTILFFSYTSYAQNVGDYRTIASGNWSTLAIWQQFDGSVWGTAINYPGQTTPIPSSVVTIQNTHNVALDVNPANEVANLTINVGGTLNLTACNFLQYSGTLVINGTTTGTVGRLVPLATGAYRSVVSGNWSVPTNWQKFNGTFWAGSVDYPGQNAPVAKQQVFVRSGNNMTANIALAHTVGGLVVYNGGTVTDGAAPYIIAPTFQNCGTVTETIINTLLVVNTNDVGAGSLRQAITDANILSGADIINFAIGTGPQTINPLSALPAITEQVTIDGYTQSGSSANTLAVGNDAVLNIEVNFAGAGTNIPGFRLNAANSILRGLVINRVTGGSSAYGVFLNATGCRIEGCFIGTDATGTISRPNDYGMGIGAANCVIGGTSPAARNLVSGNTNTGITVGAGVGVSGTLIQGNYIGTNKNGTAILGNGSSGIDVYNASTNTTIGGTSAGAGNVISGNGFGPTVGVAIYLDTNCNSNTIQGNYIGTNATGNTGLGNRVGIFILNAANNTIGGTTANARNVISGNNISPAYGIVIRGGSANFIRGNYIGTDASGTSDLGNYIGIGLEASTINNIIGGTTPAERNIISANEQAIFISSVTDNFIQGNYIGTAVDGVSDLGNKSRGVGIFNSSRNAVGGNSPNQANIIAFTKNTGSLPGARGYGVGVNGGLNGNPILGNSFFGNVIGIDLSLNGITPNDADDPDTGGNRLQNFPEFTGFAVSNGGQVTLTYKVPSVSPNSTYPLRIEFFRADAGSRQGRTYLGFDTYVSAEANTNKTITFTPATALTLGDKIVATATDANASGNNTSEFSAEVTVGLANAGLHPDDYNALVALYNATGGSNWSNQTNWLSSDAATWFGITTDGTAPGPTRRVIQISLGGNNLIGVTPAELNNMSSLNYLDIGANQLTNIVALPNNLNTLICGVNQLTSLPTLPSSLIDLACSSNQLTSLPALPNGLISLQCNDNKISALPLLPNSLNQLLCDNNRLTSLPNLPNGLQTLSLENNLLTGTIPASLGNLNSGMVSINLGTNQFTDMADFSGLSAFNPLSFNISNNKLEFDDIFPNLGKLNNDFKNYSPQASFGTPQNIIVNTGANQTLTVSTPQPAGTINSYQWYFRAQGSFSGNAIPSANSASYTITNYQDPDAGTYVCEVINNVVSALTLTSESFTVATNANGVFQQDYNALVDFYNTTGGANWTNNTNWNTAAPVSTWFGITVVNNRVTEIRLPNNNLTGDAGNTLSPVTGLKVLDLENNALTGINLSPDEVLGLASFEIIHLNNNAITGDISNFISSISNYQSIIKSLDLSNNQFSGNLSYDFGVNNFEKIEPISLPSRRGFNLSNNEITSASGSLINTPKISNNVLNVSNNRLRFVSLANFVTALYANSSQYAPQKPIPLNPNGIFGITGSLTYSSINLSSGRGGCVTTQQWFKTTDLVNPVATSNILSFSSFSASNAGTYILKATDTCVPGLELVTENLTITPLPNTFVVDNNGDIDDGNYSPGNMTLREALNLAITYGGNKTIAFNLPSNSLVINLGFNNPYPDISQANIIIDGTTQPNYGGTPLVVIDGASSFGTVAQAFNIISTGISIYGLEIRNFQSQGIRQSINNANFQIGDVGKGNYIHDNGNNGILTFGTLGKIIGNTISGNNTNGIAIQGTQNGNNITIENNKIGTNISGSTVSGTQQTGISVQGSSLGSTTLKIGSVGRGNIIGGHSSSGIDASDISGVNISGNYIGTNPNGASLGNGVGINVGVPVGSFTIDANVVSANSGSGIVINHGNFHQISNNKIGTNPAGTAALGNGLHGLYYGGGNGGNIVNNLISGNGNTNGAGIFMTVFTMTPTGTQIYSNKIGTDISGTSAIPNLEGIRIDAGANTTSIGTLANATNSNTIAYSTNVGIVIDGAGTDNNTIGINSIFCNGGNLANRGIQVTNNANNNVMNRAELNNLLTAGQPTVAYDCNMANTVTISLTQGGMAFPLSFELYQVDPTCPTNQGKKWIADLGTQASVFGNPFTFTVPLANMQFIDGKGTYVLLARDGNNSAQFSQTFTVYNKGTVIGFNNRSYGDCQKYNYIYEILLSEDSPDGQYYIDISNNDYNDLTSVQAINHKITLNVPFTFTTFPPATFDLQGMAAYFILTQSLGCLPNQTPLSESPSPTGSSIPPPVIVSAATTNPTSCATPDGRLVLLMQNVEQDQFYSIDINGDGRPDFEGVQADNNQLVVDYIDGGTEITSITVTQPALFCTSNTLTFSHFYPDLPLPDATLLVYPDLEFLDRGQETKVIVEETQQGVSYQLELPEIKRLVGKPVDGNGGTIELPTEKIGETLTYRVLAKNKVTGCSTLLETGATIAVDNKCITPADSLILVDFYQRANGPSWAVKWDLLLPACTWFGVELSGDRVVGLRLPNNGLSGRLSTQLPNLPRLRSIDVSDNFFGFEAIEPLVAPLAGKDFTYAPQAEILSPENIKAFQGRNVRISSLTGGAANRYQWYKVGANDVPIKLSNGNNISGVTEPILVFSDISLANEGTYFCEISSPIATALILFRADVKVSITPQLSTLDLSALTRFFQALGGPQWKRPWDLSKDVSFWEGLIFENGNLVQIILPDNNLIGDISNLPIEILNAEIFEDVIYMNLSNNFLKGKLPESLRRLKKLAYLDLSQNDLEGEIPVWISELSELTTLWLSYNRFDVLNKSIGDLSKLKNLFLNNNNIEQIPDEIGLLTNLEVLNLSDNFLEIIPESIGNLEKLKYLNISSNYLSFMPESVILLLFLEQLHAYDNFIEDLPDGFYLPQGSFTLVNLRVFTIDFNNLDFGDLEELVENFKKTLPDLDFAYAPQAPIGKEEEYDIPLGSAVTLAIKTDGKGNTYQWYKDGRAITGAANATFQINNAAREDAGIYYVFVSNRVANRLVLRSFAYTVRTNCVGSTDRLDIEVRGNTIYCDTEPVNTVLVAPVGTNIASYQWFLNGVRIANANNDRLSARDIGAYYVNLVSRENCINTTPPVTLRRFTPPQVSISATRDLLSATTPQTNIVGYEWFINGNPMPNATGQQLEVTQSGRYTVRVTDRNGCRGASAVYNHTLVSSEETFFAKGLNVYPNPTDGGLWIESRIEKITKVQLHDMTGRQLNLKIEVTQAQQFRLDIAHLAVGTYLLEIQTDKGTHIKKIVKQ